MKVVIPLKRTPSKTQPINIVYTHCIVYLYINHTDLVYKVKKVQLISILKSIFSNNTIN